VEECEALTGLYCRKDRHNQHPHPHPKAVFEGLKSESSISVAKQKVPKLEHFLVEIDTTGVVMGTSQDCYV